MSESNIKVTLITTVYNEIANIKRFLDSLQSQTYLPDQFVVVDGGSTDGTLECLEQFAKDSSFACLVIKDDSANLKNCPGPIARGRNIAIELAEYRLIACTDAGCVLDSIWLEKIIEPFKDPKVHVVGGGYKTTQEPEFCRKYGLAMVHTESQMRRSFFLPSSRSIAFRKTVWVEVGGYPERTLTGEDTLFCQNIISKGFQIVKRPDAFVYWDCPKTYSETWRKHYSYGYGDGQNSVQFSKFLLRFFLLLLPVHYLQNWYKIRFFTIAYTATLSHQVGYLVGFIKG